MIQTVFPGLYFMSAYNSKKLRSNGTLVTVGDNTYGQCNIEEWTDIIKVATDDWYVLVLKMITNVQKLMVIKEQCCLSIKKICG